MRELSAAQSARDGKSRAEQIIYWKCQNADPNIINLGTALSCIIKKTLEKYELCREPGSGDIRRKPAALKSRSNNP